MSEKPIVEQIEDNLVEALRQITQANSYGRDLVVFEQSLEGGAYPGNRNVCGGVSGRSFIQ